MTNIFNKAHVRNSPTILLFLDAEKVFDRLEREYMFSIVQKFGLGDNFRGLEFYIRNSRHV